MNITPESITSLIILVSLSAFFSSSETALFSLGRTQRSQLKRKNPIFGLKVLDLLSDPTQLLSLILFGNMVVNVLIFSMTYKMMQPWMQAGGGWSILAVVLPVVSLLVLGEVIPKSLALCFPYRWSLLIAYPLSWLLKVFEPIWLILHKLVPKFKANNTDFQTTELENLVEETTREGQLENSEGILIKDLIRFGVLRVSEVMIPRAEMETFQLSRGQDELRQLFESTLLTKIPVYQQTLDDTTGVIDLRDFVTKPQASLESLIRPLPLYPQQMRLHVLYQKMRLKRQKTALVVDEYGGTAGIITFKDILEEIVGEFNENLIEEEPEIRWLKDDVCEISATFPLREFEEILGEKLGQGPYLTVGGYLLERLGHMPRRGEIVKVDGIHFEIVAVERSRLLTLRVKGLRQTGGTYS